MRVLTGLQPSGRLHLGNYFSSIKEILNLQNDENEIFIFIANYHALSSDTKDIKQKSLELAASYLALGIDPKKSTMWIQSSIKEVLELYWILSSITPLGLLERAHSYKDKIAKGFEPTHALFSYPVLMAADILLFAPDVVPVGKDQIQHLEITRDLAIKLNNKFKCNLKLPSAKINENVAIIPGTDGDKMSKSYKNTIDLFVDEKTLKKQCNSIVTDSTPIDEEKDYLNCNIFNIAKHFLNEDEQLELKKMYKTKGIGYGHLKAYLKDLISEYFKSANEKYKYYISSNETKEILEIGANKARIVAKKNLEEIKNIINF